jgi:hypothetical protein
MSTVKHEPNVRQDKRGLRNTVNNRIRATLTEEICIQEEILSPDGISPDVPAVFTTRTVEVEVVRKGDKNTRIRRSLEENTDHELVPTKNLADYRKIVEA